MSDLTLDKLIRAKTYWATLLVPPGLGSVLTMSVDNSGLGAASLPRAWPASLDTAAPAQGRADQERLDLDIIELARQFGSHGYRRIAALLQDAG